MTTPGVQGEMSLESMGKMHQPSEARPTRNPPLPQLLGNTAQQSRQSLAQENRSSYRGGRNCKVKKEILTKEEIPVHHCLNTLFIAFERLAEAGQLVQFCIEKDRQSDTHLFIAHSRRS
jgi:hypothetical protein